MKPAGGSSPMSAFDPELLARIEDAGINASAPREQRWIDGWLVRFSPGKAKRARCVQAVAAGHLGLDAKLARCLALYQRAGLRPFIRITPFSEPEGLDGRLAELGMERIDDTRVMVASIDPGSAGVSWPDGHACMPCDAASFTEWIGTGRGSTPGEREAHRQRVEDAPVPHRACWVRDGDGARLAGGQVAIEDDLAGLYDVFTVPEARGRGLAGALCRHLLHLAAEEGAKTAYLQVDAENETARRVYRKLGFVDAYAYHYRSPPA